MSVDRQKRIDALIAKGYVRDDEYRSTRRAVLLKRKTAAATDFAVVHRDGRVREWSISNPPADAPERKRWIEPHDALKYELGDPMDDERLGSAS